MRNVDRTDRQDDLFFDAVQSGITIGEAAERAGYSRRGVYRYRAADEDFAERWDEAKEIIIENLEKEADRRAVEGYEKPIYHNGVQVGAERRFSDTLLIFRLKALAPDKYRERTDVNHTVSETPQIVINRPDGD